MNQTSRQKAILELLKTHGTLTIPMLQEQFNASRATIYRDIQIMSMQQKLCISKGRIVSFHEPSTMHMDAPYYEKMQDNAAEKQRIAWYAYRIIKPQMTIFLDSSTTVYYMCSLLEKARDVKVVTNDIRIASALYRYENISVHVLGGALRFNYYTLISHTVDAALRHMNIDVGFFSCDAFSAKQGCMITNPEETTIKKQLLSLTKYRVLLCDHSKINRIAFMSFAKPSDLDIIVTGSEISEMLYQQTVTSITTPIVRV